jgi:imidazolonepropionase-like amidohydrolase
MKKDAELGSIAEGKLADMVLVAGDPTKNIADIRKVKTVIKDGAVIEAADIARFLGVKPAVQ